MCICVWNSLLETWTLSLLPTLHKHLYLWSDHRTMGARWYNLLNLMLFSLGTKVV